MAESVPGDDDIVSDTPRMLAGGRCRIELSVLKLFFVFLVPKLLGFSANVGCYW